MNRINPDNMVVTNDGNLIMADAGRGEDPNPFIHKVTMFDCLKLSVIYTTLEQEIASVTSDPTTGGNIFVGDGGVIVFDPNGVPMPNNPMNCDFDSHVGTLAYVRNSPSFSDGLYAKVGTDLVYINIRGNKKIIGSGLESVRDIAFAPDGQLYLIMSSGDVLRTYATCIADFNGDGDVDGSDLAVFVADFGRTDCTGDCKGDFDIDGDVDGSDLAIFAYCFGRTDYSLQEL